MEIIKTKDLSFYYGNSEKKVLNNISLDINKGDFLLLFGKSGSGKSTLIKNIKHSICPYGKRTGDILYLGKDVNSLGIKEECTKIGYVSQNIEGSIVTDKVWHEMAFTLENLGYDDKLMKSRIGEISSFFGINKWLNKDVSALSLGQKQKLIIASTMLVNPDILLLDEPTSSLDPVMAKELMNLLKMINEEMSTTIIIAEHSFDNIIDKVNKCVLLDKGNIEYIGSNKECIKYICNKHKNDDIYKFLPVASRLAYEIFNEDDIVSLKESKLLMQSSNIPNGEILIEDINRSKEEVISIKNLYFRYEKKEEDILKDLSISIKSGDFISIVGGNGEGKSTLFSIISGMKKAVKGKVNVKGRMSMLPQNPTNLFVYETVREEFEEISEDYMWIVDYFNIHKLLNMHPYDISGGEQQLVGIIKVILTDSDIFLLDEPTKQMDVIYKDKLGNLLKRLNKEEGKTILMISHDIEFACKYSSYTGFMFDKGLVNFQESKKVFSNNYFYTTKVSKIVDKKIENATLLEEVIQYAKENSF